MLSAIVGSATSEMCYSLGHVKVMSIFLWQSESLSWGGLSEEIETEKAEPTYSLTIKCLPRDDEKGKEKEREVQTHIHQVWMPMVDYVISALCLCCCCLEPSGLFVKQKGVCTLNTHRHDIGF